MLVVLIVTLSNGKVVLIELTPEFSCGAVNVIFSGGAESREAPSAATIRWGTC